MEVHELMDVHEIPWKSMEVRVDVSNVDYLCIERGATCTILRLK